MLTNISRALLTGGILLLAPWGDLRAGLHVISPTEALQYFQEADAISRSDGGQLWGVSLGGGLLLVDPETRVAYANQPDPQVVCSGSVGFCAGKSLPT